MLFAIGITPNLLSQRRSGEARAFYSAARRIVVSARETAINTKTPVFLTYDDSQSRLVVSRKDAEGEQDTELSHVDFPEEIRAVAFQIDGADSNSADWSIGFYPDGTADPGGIQFELGNGRRGLAIANNGHATLADGEIPETATERWEAGSYEQRL